MSLTPNFGMNIPDSTDIVNLLTQCYPNFTLLDTVLQTIKESGTTVATETKVGTAHQLVRVVPDCSVIRFVATSNYTAGDTFTVDGNPVTATAPDGTSLPTGAYVINMNVFAILTGSQLTVFAGKGEITAQDTSYDNTGSGLSATDVQAAIDEVEGNVDTLANTVSNIPVIKGASFSNATMTAGQLNIGALVPEPFLAIVGIKFSSLPAGFPAYVGCFSDFGGTARMNFFTAAGSLITTTETGFSGDIYYI